MGPIDWPTCPHCCEAVRPEVVFAAANAPSPEVSPENWELTADVECPFCREHFEVYIRITVELEQD